jgi:hypothetical protein
MTEPGSSALDTAISAATTPTLETLKNGLV